MKKIDGVRISIWLWGVMGKISKILLMCLIHHWTCLLIFPYCVELKGCVWVLTEQEEVGEFENNWVGKGGEL